MVALNIDWLLRAVQEHVEDVVGNDKPSRDLAEAVKKAATMWPGGRSARACVHAMVSAMESYFLLHSQAEVLYRSADGKYIPDLAEHIATRVQGSHPEKAEVRPSMEGRPG